MVSNCGEPSKLEANKPLYNWLGYGRKTNEYAWLKVRSGKRPMKSKLSPNCSNPWILLAVSSPLTLDLPTSLHLGPGCQQAITALLTEKQADYVIGLKAHPDGLYEQVADWFERAGSSLPVAVSRDMDHGRAEKRIGQGNEAFGLIDAVEGWKGSEA